MKVSIIIPFKNAEQWLDRSAKSLFNQTGEDLEFLFVNDNSDDNGKAIIANYSDERFVLIDNERSPGVSGARNTGIDHATGDWIGFLDADDEMAPDLYKNCYLADMISKVSVIQFNHLRHYALKNRTISKTSLYNKAGIYNTNKMPILWEYVTNKIYRKDLISNIRFDEDMQWGEDELFNLECLAKAGAIQCIEKFYFIHHFDNKSSLSKTKGEEGLLIQIHKLEDFLLAQDDPMIRTFVCHWLAVHWESNTYKTIIGHKEE